VIVLNGYPLLNVYICGYLLYCRYQKKKVAKWFYIPFVFIAIVWAISIHTVTAFLYVGLGGRPFWNSAIVGPRFLASAFTAGPALIILAMQVVAASRFRSRGRCFTGAAGRGGATATVESPSPAHRSRAAGLSLARNGFGPQEVRQGILSGATVLSAGTGDVLLRQGETEIMRSSFCRGGWW